MLKVASIKFRYVRLDQVHMGRDVANVLWPEFYQKSHEHSEIGYLQLVDKVENILEADIVDVRDIDLEARHMGNLVLIVAGLIGLVVVQEVAIGPDLVGDGLHESDVEGVGNGFQGRLGDDGRTELHHAMDMGLLQNLVAVIIDARIAVVHDEAARKHQLVQLVAPIIRKILYQLHEPPATGFLDISLSRHSNTPTAQTLPEQYPGKSYCA